MNKKILIILGHSADKSFCRSLAEAYRDGAGAGGYEVKSIDIGKLKFDPILHQGYQVIQALEPGLLKSQEYIKWADHIVFIFPLWWSSMPALLKGFFDRVFIPGFAYHMEKNSKLPKKFLTKRSARIIITSGAPSLINCLEGNTGFKTVKNALSFCGIKPIKLTSVGGVEDLKPVQRKSWLDKIKKLGKEGK